MQAKQGVPTRTYSADCIVGSAKPHACVLGSLLHVLVWGPCRISKLYVQDSCISLRDNQLGWTSYKSLVCLSADDDGSKTCKNVFNNGKNLADAVGAASILAQVRAA